MAGHGLADAGVHAPLHVKAAGLLQGLHRLGDGLGVVTVEDLYQFTQGVLDQGALLGG